MPTDMKIWRQRLTQAVAGIADEAMQRRAWFGIGPECSSPEEEFAQFLDDLSIDKYLDKNNKDDTGLSEHQLTTLRQLKSSMRLLSQDVHKTQRSYDPWDLIDDPRWKRCREIASSFLQQLGENPSR